MTAGVPDRPDRDLNTLGSGSLPNTHVVEVSTDTPRTGLRAYEAMIAVHAINHRSGVSAAVEAMSGVMRTSPRTPI